jgi:hypothetical protein
MRLSIPTAIALAAISATALAAGPEAARPFNVQGDPAAADRSLECLTQAIYYEARGQSDDGQRAVAQVVLNRVRHPAYPNTVCGVVYQGSQRATGCQFTFTCDGSMYRRAIDPAAWDRARRIADAALHGSVYRPVGLATNYHTTAINPYWAPSLVPQVVLGAHIFYRRPGDGGRADAFTQAPAADDPNAAYLDDYALRPLEESAPRTHRWRGTGGPAPAVERAVMEIPVVERPIVYRAVATRSFGGAPRQPGVRPAAAGTPRQTPRVMIQNGVRIFRGS